MRYQQVVQPPLKPHIRDGTGQLLETRHDRVETQEGLDVNLGPYPFHRLGDAKSSVHPPRVERPGRPVQFLELDRIRLVMQLARQREDRPPTSPRHHAVRRMPALEQPRRINLADQERRADTLFHGVALQSGTPQHRRDVTSIIHPCVHTQHRITPATVVNSRTQTVMPSSSHRPPDAPVTVGAGPHR
jgi:hypothetical protein